ncbi:alpha-N-acetylglucosaminidase isoform X2 [Nymphaea colorata]|uniref:alpha-N-acetylglucosaminidase isoform X2 n=1 Tax=Nymphaea colorata TaxID=210225 RepID=UPI00129D59FA|nr:alpha-N-acetylglucosaminidase isoform X2 [Nymphaea colorata]
MQSLLPYHRLLLRLRLFIIVIVLLLSGDRANGGFNLIQGLLRKLDDERAPSAVQEEAAMGVLRRLLPSHVSSFTFQIVPRGSCGGYSCFSIDDYNSSSEKEPEILIKGTTAVEMAFGLHWYLKYWCGAHISWDKTGGPQLASVPRQGSLPHVGRKGVKIQRPVPWSYYQNVVTSSYSFAWWDWDRWVKEIDWMVLNGINLPLAFTGQESIWQKVFKRFNITDADLSDFFGGPAFLAWARMGNLHGWGGPLSQAWLDGQLNLQKLILARMLELGMTPVLPSFSGNVPAALKRIFPSAHMTRLGDWNTVDGDRRWCCNYLLDPSDPLFIEIGGAFIKEQIKEYGATSHIYNCDTFNENTPPTDNPEYISSLGAAVYKAMHNGDSDAVWLMQGWLFSAQSSFWKPPQMKALLHSVPFGKMVVLDLFADVKPIWLRASQFYGTPYIWCMLHNFGGNLEMYGSLDAIASGPVDARLSQNSTMVGVGLCMEGIEQNPVVYELMAEMAFRSKKVQVQQWIKSYSHRRYGQQHMQLESAWDILYRTIYNCTDGIADHNKDFIVELPDISPVTTPHLWYPPKEVIRALQLFLDGGYNVAGSPTYRYDLVDLTRQVLSKFANQVYREAIHAFQVNDLHYLTVQSKKFIDLIKDIDILLGSNDNFLLGTWLESAKGLGTSPQEKQQYEWNARTQVTMWYDNTKTKQSMLHDYANKYWSGLLEDYYLPRACTYFGYLLKSLRENRSFPLDQWRGEWIAYSNKWQAGSQLYSVKATGDSFSISRSLFRKYIDATSY